MKAVVVRPLHTRVVDHGYLAAQISLVRDQHLQMPFAPPSGETREKRCKDHRDEKLYDGFDWFSEVEHHESCDATHFLVHRQFQVVSEVSIPTA